MSDQHESPIKTPRQLITIVVLAFVVPITLIALLSQLVTSRVEGLKENQNAVLARIKAVCNKHVRNQVNLTEDLGLAYGILDFWEHAAAGAWEEDGD